MARYRYLAVDLVSGVIRDELPLVGCTFGARLNRPGGFTAQLRADHPAATVATLDAARTLVVVEREGLVVGDGIVWSPRVDAMDPNGSKLLELEGSSLASWLYLQRLTSTREYVQVPQAVLVGDLIGWAQGRGSLSYGDDPGPSALGADLGIAVDLLAGGQARDRTYLGYERHVVGELLANLGDVIGGPTWRLQVRWEGTGEDRQLVRRAVVDPPGGRLLGEPFVYGANVDGYGLGRVGLRLARRVDAVGAGEGDDQLVATAEDTTDAAAFYPYASAVIPHLSVSRPATLVEHAVAELASRRLPPTVVEVRLAPDATPRLGSFRPGDRARVVIDDGWATIDEVRRIVEYEVTVDREGREVVVVRFDVPEVS